MSLIQILFEDDDFLFANKEAGIPVHSTYDKKRPDFFSLLCKQLDRSPQNTERYLSLHNRLDVETSGIVALAKSFRGNEALRSLFQDRLIEKNYWAITSNKETHDKKWIVENFLAEKDKKMIAVRSGGDKAITHFQILSEGDKYFLIEAKPLTGRRHQIRSHLESSKLPIVGDSLYGSKISGVRTLLHAKALSFVHPTTQKKLSIEAPLPQDFLAYSEYLDISL
ncbi:MAG: RluA family pseudouridine synthase [Pseudobdellovibrionaceae bacterium]